ncbi:GCD complex subunit gcd7 [Extremus antarcticus]|uniref:Translation initiation factor eIF2B subunit beta n=1 Tax=Extremus antarcticus TaxID=702011 RepID=A0AAJ0DJL7_9PEZI|nr:GCD complex subunit gcd7 [Extremus antarcticus]
MPAATVGQTPSLSTFVKSLKTNSIESSIELLASLLKRRQIKNSRQCALATAQLLLRVVAAERIKDPQKLIDRIRDVGRRLVAAQPREMAVGNIVRRILGVVREVIESQAGDDGSGSSAPSTPTSPAHRQSKRPMISHSFSSFTPLSHSAAMPYDMHPRPGTPMDSSASTVDGMADLAAPRRPGLASSASYASTAPQNASLLSFLEHPLGRSPAGTPPSRNSPRMTPVQSSTELNKEKIDIKAEVIDGIKELLDELEVVDTQIAESALDHIHSNETILTTTSSQTVQKFLSTAARKRKFTVIHAEAYPNDHEITHATILNGGKKSSGEDEEADERWKPLTALGITVILIPDTAVFALMSRINKVILAPHTVLANGSLLAAAGASTIALAAQAHHVPVVVLSGVYKLSPVYPFDTQELIEYGDPGKVVPFEEGDFMSKIDVQNPLYDFVDAELVSLYVTNLGGCAPSFLYRIVADHYRVEDTDLSAKTG